MSRRKNYPNNWQEYHDAPSEYFESCSFDDFMDWKVRGWDLPDSVVAIVRCKTPDKIEEWTYSTVKGAQEKVKKLTALNDATVTVVTHHTISELATNDLSDTERDRLAGG